MSATNITEDAILDWLYRNVTPATIGTVYLALFTGNPGETGSYTDEVTGGAYIRQAVVFGAPTGGTVSNTGVITFPVATADWGIITHFAIINAVTGTVDKMLTYGALGSTETILTGNQLQIAIGDIAASAD